MNYPPDRSDRSGFHCFQERIRGSFLEVADVSSFATPTMMGAMTVYSDGKPSSVFTMRIFRKETAAPMTQLVGVFNQKVLSLLYVLKAVEEKKSKATKAKPAAKSKKKAE